MMKKDLIVDMFSDISMLGTENMNDYEEIPFEYVDH
jgi:hypothetical protein